MNVILGGCGKGVFLFLTFPPLLDSHSITATHIIQTNYWVYVVYG